MVETRKLAAILIADVVGYSLLTGADEEGTLARLRSLRSDLINPTIGIHNGRVVKRTGDGAIVEFRSVVEAVRCAIDVQRGLAERNVGVPDDKRIEARVGIHLGDVVEESDGDLMGDGVNIAARLEGIAKPGAICLSDDAYRQVKGRLDIAVSDLGLIELKNIAEPIHVYSLEVGKPALAKPVMQPKRAKPKDRLRLALLSAGIAALVILAAAGAWRFSGANRTGTVAPNASAPLAAQRLSFVVLPFANLSGDPAQDYLADALTDELTTALTRIPESFVIASNTAFTFKDKPVDAKAIGKDLGVRFVLEGSVQPNGNQVRVHAQLIDADSGAQLWADQFDTARADLLQMQDEIVARLAHALELKYVDLAAARLKRTPAANPAAEDLALQCYGILLKNGYVSKEADAGYRLCEQALAAEPNNVHALTVLSVKFWFPVALGRSADPKGDLGRADELVSRALALDPNFAGAHVVRANILRVQGRLDDAIAESERALALDPAHVDAYGTIGGAYTQLGQFENGLEFTDKAIRLSPHDSGLIYWYADKASDYIGLGQYDQAIEWARRAVAVDPNDPSAHYVLGLAYAFLGQDDKALEEFDKAIQLTPQGSSVNAYYREKANVYFGLKQYDEAIAWARRTIALDWGDWGAQAVLIAALALTGQNAEAQEALQRYLALPSGGPRTIAEFKASSAQYEKPNSNPGINDFFKRRTEGLRQAGMPEK